MPLVPLDTASSYSLLDGIITPQQLATAAKQRGYSAMVMADDGVMYGAVEFYQAALAVGVKPVLGLRLSLAIGDVGGNTLPTLFIAQNLTGYQHLMILSSVQQTQDQPHPLTVQEIHAFLGDLFVVVLPTDNVGLAAGNSGSVEMLATLRQVVDTEHLLMGINPQINQVLKATVSQVADHYQMPLVAASTVRYLAPQDRFAYLVAHHIADNTAIANPLAVADEAGKQFLPTAEQLATDYQSAGLQDAADRCAQLIADCQLQLKFQPPVLPHFPTPAGLTAAEYLHRLCEAGLKKRSLAKGFTADQYQQRLNRELRIIHQLGFDDYFLIVHDVIAFTKQQQILTDAGRGSAAGSLVAYVLGITEVDPLQFDLLFERFLNPERQQMPDIDLDLPDDQRMAVLQYLHKKYGHRRVAQIVTFGTLGAKQVVRDVARVLGYSKFEIADLAAQVPAGATDYASAVQQSPQLQVTVNSSAMGKLLDQTARQLSGLPRQTSVHAAGIVLAASPLHSIVPLKSGSDGLLVTQYAKETVEQVGLLKMDFLGLRNLTILSRAVADVQQDHPHLAIHEIDLNDEATLRLFQRGETTGIFQFESNGIRRTLVDLHPERFEDIVAVDALYRPGPLENIPHYIARKRGTEHYSLPDPSLAPILQPTYGILVYQEQVMQLAAAMAGFSLGQADILRRAMSKKKRAVMEKMRQQFVAGALANGYSQEVAVATFDYIDQFANYGFNHSHAVAYTKFAFELAYLKVHFAPQFYNALLSKAASVDKLRKYVRSAQKHGVTVHGPHVNLSQVDFSRHGQELYFGLGQIKGMRKDVAQEIIHERHDHGPFVDLPNFISRMNGQGIKQPQVEILIKAGAFDQLKYNRQQMVKALPDLFSADSGQGSINLDSLGLGNDFATTLPASDEYPLLTKLGFEKDLLGMNLSGHPTTPYRQLSAKLHASQVADVVPGRTYTLVLFISKSRQVTTRRDQRQMAFVTASDATGSIEVTVFPKQYDQYHDLLRKSAVVVVNGKAEERNGRLQLIANRLQSASQLNGQLVADQSSRWVIKVIDQKSADQVSRILQTIAHRHGGNCPVVVYYAESGKTYQQPAAQNLQQDDQVRKLLADQFGSNNVFLQQQTNNK